MFDPSPHLYGSILSPTTAPLPFGEVKSEQLLTLMRPLRRYAPQDDMVLKDLVVKFYRKLRSNNCFGA